MVRSGIHDLLLVEERQRAGDGQFVLVSHSVGDGVGA